MSRVQPANRARLAIRLCKQSRSDAVPARQILFAAMNLAQSIGDGLLAYAQFVDIFAI